MDSELAVTCTVDGSNLVGLALAVAGTQHMFRVVGSPVTSLDSHATAVGIQIVGFDNELSAGYAAVDYGFLTGIPAVVVTTSGPGCIDALAGLSYATANACPFLLLSTYGDRAESSRGKLQEQEVDHDQTAATSPAMVALKVNTISEIPRLVFWAHAAAIDKGCYLDIPSEVLQQTLSRSDAAGLVEAAFAAAADSAITGHAPQKPQAIRKAVVKAVDLLRHAERPLLVFETAELYGDEEAAAIRKLVQVMGIPFLNTPMRKPVVPESHPLSVSAKAARSLAIGQCDAALVFGGGLNRLPHSVETPKCRKDIKFVLVNVYEKNIGLV